MDKITISFLYSEISVFFLENQLFVLDILLIFDMNVSCANRYQSIEKKVSNDEHAPNNMLKSSNSFFVAT